MFQKIIKRIKPLIKKIKEFTKSLDSEEKFMLGTSVGLVFLGFLIYLTWQTRLIDPNPENEVEENQETEINNEENHLNNEETDQVYKNEIHGYEIDLNGEIEEISRVNIFGVRKNSDFIINYKGVVHAVFENSENLSIREWVDYKIDQKGPRGESLEDQKSFLNIMFVREKSTPLGEGVEVVRMNDFQSGELFISRDDYIMAFIYEVESAREVSSMESRREELIENIN